MINTNGCKTLQLRIATASFPSSFEKKHDRFNIKLSGNKIMATQVHNGTNAIVIDDNKDLLDVFVELLQLNGIDVIGSGVNGKEAVELYQKLHPDVVFIDALMPKYDGFYGLKKIRECNPNALVFLVTGSANIEKKLDGCTATAILEKPINMSKIMNAVNRFCTH